MNKRIGCVILIFLIVLEAYILNFLLGMVDETNNTKNSIENLNNRVSRIERSLIKPEQKITVTLTGYTLTKEECNNDLENTAAMMEPLPGYTCAVSVDLRHLLGKKIYIYGYGVWYVSDLLNKRYSKSVDLLVWEKKTAWKIGRRINMDIVVLDQF